MTGSEVGINGETFDHVGRLNMAQGGGLWEKNTAGGGQMGLSRQKKVDG